MTTPEIRMIANVEVSKDRQYPLATFAGSFVYVDAEDHDKLKNPSHGDWRDKGVGHLDSLAITAQVDYLEPGDHWYGFRIEYRQPYSVSLEYAQTMVTTLKKVNRHLERLDAKFGAPTDLAAYIGRVGDALGVNGYCWRRGKAGMFYSDADYALVDIDGLRYWLGAQLTEARPKKAEAS